MHPLVSDLSSLKDNEVESRINDLTKKYFSSSNNEVRNQIIMILDTYREEMSKRQQASYNKMMSSRNKDLDKLIKVN